MAAPVLVHQNMRNVWARSCILGYLFATPGTQTTMSGLGGNTHLRTLNAISSKHELTQYCIVNEASSLFC